jgi:hypothetical protein
LVGWWVGLDWTVCDAILGCHAVRCEEVGGGPCVVCMRSCSSLRTVDMCNEGKNLTSSRSAEIVLSWYLDSFWSYKIAEIDDWLRFGDVAMASIAHISENHILSIEGSQVGRREQRLYATVLINDRSSKS